MPLDQKLAAECADWIAEQLIEEFGGFMSAEFVDAVIEYEQEIRVAHSDPEMDHHTMMGHLVERLKAEGAPVGGYGGVTPELITEVLHYEDEFLGYAGQPRKIR